MQFYYLMCDQEGVRATLCTSTPSWTTDAPAAALPLTTRRCAPRASRFHCWRCGASRTPWLNSSIHDHVAYPELDLWSILTERRHDLHKGLNFHARWLRLNICLFVFLFINAVYLNLKMWMNIFCLSCVYFCIFQILCCANYTEVVMEVFKISSVFVLVELISVFNVLLFICLPKSVWAVQSFSGMIYQNMLDGC